MKMVLPLIAAALAASLLLTFSATPVSARGGGGHGGGMGGGGMGGGPGGGRGPTTQPNQNKSLTETVSEDQLSDKETDGLKSQGDTLQKAADGMTGDDKLTKDELDAFEAAFDAASFFIWSKGTDDDGKVTTRYGTSVFPVDALTKLEDAQKLTRPEAKSVLLALKALSTAKLKLNDKMAPVDRASLERQFNQALAKYYMLK